MTSARFNSLDQSEDVIYFLLGVCLVSVLLDCVIFSV